MNDRFGFPRVDMAWAKSQERARRRSTPSWEVQKARFQEQVKAEHYARALGKSV